MRIARRGKTLPLVIGGRPRFWLWPRASPREATSVLRSVRPPAPATPSVSRATER